MRGQRPLLAIMIVASLYAQAVAAQTEVAQEYKLPAGIPAEFQYTPPTAGFMVTGTPHLQSAVALVVDQADGKTLYAKNPHIRTPIASITKLMTAMVTLDANLPMDEVITITENEIDTLKGTRSRLHVGMQLTRLELLQLALMASENRAAAALGRTYPGGQGAFMAAMQHKAASLGMVNSHFADATGLDSRNLSTAEDLVKMVKAAYRYQLISDLSTSPGYYVANGDRYVAYKNTNKLVNQKDWVIGLSKTGFINESGRCLVMQTFLNNKPVIMVLLDSAGKFTRIADAVRVKQWLEGVTPTRIAGTRLAKNKSVRVAKQNKPGKRFVLAKPDKRKRVVASLKSPHYR